jgi:hypothetical protein
VSDVLKGIGGGVAQWYKIRHTTEVDLGFVATFDKTGDRGMFIFCSDDSYNAYYFAWTCALVSMGEMTAGVPANLVVLPRAETGNASVKIMAWPQSYTSVDTLDDVTCAIWFDDKMLLVHTVPYDANKGKKIGFGVYESDTLTIDNLQVPQFHQITEWTSVDPGEAASAGLSRVIAHAKVRVQARYDGAVRIWRNDTTDSSWTVQAWRPLKADEQQQIFWPTHLRLAGAMHESDAFRDDTQGHIFAIGQDPNALTEEATNDVAVIKQREMEEGAHTLALAMAPNPVIEPEDVITYDGDKWRVSAISYRVGWRGGQGQGAPVDKVIIARLEGLDRLVILGKIASTQGSSLSHMGVLAPPSNFSVLAYPAMVYAQWDTYPGEDLSWEIQYSLTGSPYSDAAQVLVSRGSYYIHPCDPGTTIYMRARAARWLGDNNLMYSGWTSWASVSAADYEVPNLIIDLTNKSGGARIATEVVIVDTTTDESFTTTTSVGDLTVIGIVMEGIADDAAGQVCISGLCQVLIDNSVTRGHYLQASATAGRADGSAARTSGSFARALESGVQDDAIWAIVSLPMATGGAINHNDLLNIDGGTPGEYYHLTSAQHTSFTVVAGAGYALVSTGANVWAADQTPAWTGEHSFAAGIAFTGASSANEITVPDNTAIALEILDAGGLEYLRINSADANPYLLLDPAGAGVHVGIGTNDPDMEHVYIFDDAVVITEAFFGLRVNHAITDATGATEADDVYGTRAAVTLNDSGETIGNMYGMYLSATLTDGIIGDGEEDLVGLRATTAMNGGTANNNVTSWQAHVDLNAGTIANDIRGLFINVDIEAAVTSIGGDVYGALIQVDADKDPVGTAYGLYLDCRTNVDYGVYQTGVASNYFAGSMKLANLAGVGVRTVVAAADGTLSAP